MKLSSLFRALRPHHWAKNIVVFGALVFDRKLMEPVYFNRTAAAFGLLCLLASSVYLLNDIVDRDRDRRHPKKRFRPVASGELSQAAALGIGLLLALLVLPLGYFLNFWFGCLATIYWFQNLAYSLRLKHVVIIDVFIIAFGFILRVACGAVLVDVEQAPVGSPWIYMCIALGALFIALGKRRHELTLTKVQPHAHRDVLNHYTVPLIDWMLVTVSTSTIVAYSLYTFSAPNLPQNHLMMLTIPFVLYGLFRYLYLIHVEGKGGTPDKLFFEDFPLFISVILWAACAVGIMYWPYP